MKAMNRRLIYIELRLQTWARWYTAIIEGNFGYAKVSWDVILQPRSRRCPKQLFIPINEKAEEMDAAIIELWRTMPDFARVLYARYLMPGSGRDHAKQLNISYACFNRQLYMAKVWLVSWFAAKNKYDEALFPQEDAI